MNPSKLFDYSQPIVAGATVLAVGAIVVALIGAYTVLGVVHARDAVDVTGSAKQSVAADTARWTIQLQTKTGVSDQQSGYDRLDSATKKVTDYLATKGFTDVEAQPVTSYTEYSYPDRSAPILTGYNVTRQIIVHSTDINAIDALSGSIDPFSGWNYQVTTQSVEYTYSKLDEMRVTLLAEAIKDAKARANAIASDSGKSVGALRNASSGVVQVLPAGGIDISDYGAYDTQSKNKDIMVTVHATFEL